MTRRRLTIAVAVLVAAMASVGTVLAWMAGVSTAHYPEVSDGDTRIAGAYTITTHDGSWMALATLAAVITVVAVFIAAQAVWPRRPLRRWSDPVDSPGSSAP
ncbi:hypothetical protein [Williamsia sterculiae]|uniref:Tryptophan-associated transmembrane protein (Trp_oprn_chp) n=1 Tax=Williamsia sterculiae TaxID=1344003 RepID=A0A1N7CWW0_9NOCA|nr:hypothetical protein [Williamsia sterculiae]SIR68030.1 hypothetical protein SAMN05445060_0415 [Williamsia sterculiae]